MWLSCSICETSQSNTASSSSRVVVRTLLLFFRFFVYVGKENTEDGSAVAVYEELITTVGLTVERGRVLTTDIWYTSITLATLLFETYGWTLVGTIVPKDKVHRRSLRFHLTSYQRMQQMMLPRVNFVRPSLIQRQPTVRNIT